MHTETGITEGGKETEAWIHRSGRGRRSDGQRRLKAAPGDHGPQFGGVRVFAVAVIRQELPWFDARSDHLVQQVAEFLEAVAERALLLDGTIRCGLEDSRTS